MQATENQLALLVTESGLPSEQQDILTTQFADFFGQVATWSERAGALVVTSESQKQEMKQAGEGRKFLKGLRVKVEHTRKELKEESLKQGKAIDLIASRLKAAIEPIEAHLQLQETFAVRAAAERKESLRAERHAALQPYTSNPEFYPLGEMEARAFDELCAGLKLGHEKKQEEARLAEQQRQADAAAAAERQQQEAAAREAQRQENERLRNELAEQEAARKREQAETERKRQAFEAAAAEARRGLEERARAEREAAETKQREAEAEARREREAAEQLRRENAERLAAEERAQQARAEETAAAQRRAAATPDREKLLALIEALNAVALPELATPEAQKITAGVHCLLAKVNVYIREKAELL